MLIALVTGKVFLSILDYQGFPSSDLQSCGFLSPNWLAFYLIIVDFIGKSQL